MGFLLSALMFFSTSAKAYLVKENAILISDTKVNFVPNYFFKPDPTGRYIGYSGSNNRVFIYDLKDKKSYSAQGNFDPVFFPLAFQDLKLISTSKKGILFFNFQDVLKSQESAKLLLKTSSDPAVYQSLGILSQTSKDEFKFRMIQQTSSGENSKNFSFNDFIYSKSGSTEKITSAKVNFTPVCKDHFISMAMISKDGQEVVAYDMKEKRSRIFQLSSNGSCQLTDDLGQIFSKASFSYNRRYVAYHNIAKENYSRDGFIKVPRSSAVGNIFVYDRKTKNHYPITQFEIGTAAYPEFLENGDLLFIYYQPTTDRDPQVRFIRLNLTLPDFSAQVP